MLHVSAMYFNHNENLSILSLAKNILGNYFSKNN